MPHAAPPSDSSSGARPDYDLLIVGSGSAGVAAAIRGSELGATVAIVEGADVIGGTCVNVGCIPSKNLIEAAHAYHTARTGFPGIAPCEPRLAWAEVMRQKREIVQRLRKEKYGDVLQSYDRITLLRGRAELRDEGAREGMAVRVGERNLLARRVLIATGTRPHAPPIPGLADSGALDSTTAMELEQLPRSLLVLGAGSIGLELGQVFQRFGVRVTVVEAIDRVLPGEGQDVSRVLAAALEAEGMALHTGARVTRVIRAPQGVRVLVERNGLTSELEAESLLVATGRIANTESLGLRAAGVRTDDRGHVVVNGHMRTSNPRVFAAGDVTGGPGFVYVAALQGGIAAEAALAYLTGATPAEADLRAVPRVTFTDPQVAAVGLTDAEAKTAGIAATATSLDLEHLPRAMVSHRRSGIITLVAESGTDRLLGAHVVAPNAGDLIGEAVLAVRFGLTTRDIVSTLHPYLTWGEGLKLAAQTFTRDVTKLSCCA